MALEKNLQLIDKKELGRRLHEMMEFLKSCNRIWNGIKIKNELPLQESNSQVSGDKKSPFTTESD